MGDSQSSADHPKGGPKSSTHDGRVATTDAWLQSQGSQFGFGDLVALFVVILERKPYVYRGPGLTADRKK